ncbi:hypothetical protein HLVA_04500 [Haliovirga abyssi]|uniref:S1 motif domain-containing protein n=2 Tax=Haliovirga abyssi TaxID=2996794 RepID=A0AAU9D8H1_9FUSO|nr:hypothetical protein HLVA_04500 [Haliovirga abyssi]
MENVENFEELLEQYLPNIENGEVVKGHILRKDTDYGYMDIGAKGEAKVRVNEINNFEIGEDIEVVVTSKSEDRDGYLKVSRLAYDLEKNWAIINEKFESKEVLEGVVTKKVNGGYIVDIFKYKTFLPGSLSLFKDSEEVLNKKINVIIKDVKDGKRKKIIVSRKEAENRKIEEEMKSVNIGDIVKGNVKEILDFGIIVKIGNLSGLVHFSEISWKKGMKFKEKYSVGDEIEVKIIDINRSKKNLKLSIKQLTTDPWENIEEKYPVGKEVEGTVENIEKYGAFIEVEEGIEGLLHISDLSWGKKLGNIEKFIKIGDKVTVKIIELDKENKKIKLGLKQLTEDPWKSAGEKYTIGKVVDSKIESIQNYGLFVKLEEGVDAFVHIADIAWLNPSVKGYNKGDMVKVKILEFNEADKRIKAGIKQLEVNPWDEIFEKYKVGDRVKRKIKEISKFGLFVEIESGIDGMIHISQASKDFIKNLEENYKIGDEVEAEIIDLDKENKKIKLSIKKLELKRVKEEEKEMIEKYGTTE